MATIESLQAENSQLRELLDEQDAKLERAIFAIYKLHEGLYSHTTQSYMVNYSNALLYGQPLLEPPVHREHVIQHSWPTTRQGDGHELRIQQLEETIKQLDAKVQYLLAKQSLVKQPLAKQPLAKQATL